MVAALPPSTWPPARPVAPKQPGLTPKQSHTNRCGFFYFSCPVLNMVYTFPPNKWRNSLTFKLSLVEQIEKGELTYKQAQVRYGIQGRSTVLVWLRKHGRQDWSQGASVRAGRSITMPDPDNQTPEQRIKELEQQLALMSQKAQFFEAIVDVLKNDYGVSIVKKRPGKSSRSGKSRG